MSFRLSKSADKLPPVLEALEGFIDLLKVCLLGDCFLMEPASFEDEPWVGAMLYLWMELDSGIYPEIY